VLEINQVNPESLEDKLNLTKQFRIVAGVDINEAYRYYVKGEGKGDSDSNGKDVAPCAIHSQLVSFLSSLLERSVYQHASGSELHFALADPLGYKVKDYFKLAELRVAQMNGSDQDIGPDILEDVRQDLAAYAVEKMTTAGNNLRVATVLKYCETSASRRPTLQSLFDTMEEKMEDWARPSCVRINLENDNNLFHSMFQDVLPLVASHLNDHRVAQINNILARSSQGQGLEDLIALTKEGHQQLVNEIVTACLPFIHAKATEQINNLVELPEFQSGDISREVKKTALAVVQGRQDSYHGFDHQQREVIFKDLQNKFGSQWVICSLFSIMGCAVTSGQDVSSCVSSQLCDRLQEAGPYFSKEWIHPFSFHLLYYDINLLSTFLEGYFPDYFQGVRRLDLGSLTNLTTTCVDARDMPTALIQQRWSRENGSLVPWGTRPQFYTIAGTDYPQFACFNGSFELREKEKEKETEIEKNDAQEEQIAEIVQSGSPNVVPPRPPTTVMGEIIQEVLFGESENEASSRSPSPMATKMMDVSKIVPSGKINFFDENNPLAKGRVKIKDKASTSARQPLGLVVNNQNSTSAMPVAASSGTQKVQTQPPHPSTSSQFGASSSSSSSSFSSSSSSQPRPQQQPQPQKRGRGRPKGSGKSSKSIKVRKGGLPVRKRQRGVVVANKKTRKSKSVITVNDDSDTSSLSSDHNDNSDDEDDDLESDADEKPLSKPERINPVRACLKPSITEVSNEVDMDVDADIPFVLRLEATEQAAQAGDFKINTHNGASIIDPGSTFTKSRVLAKTKKNDGYALGTWKEFRTDLLLARPLHLTEEQFNYLNIVSFSSYDAGMVSSVDFLGPLVQSLLKFFELPLIIEQHSNVATDVTRIWGVKAKSLIVSRSKVLISNEFLCNEDVMLIPRYPVTEDIEGLVLDTRRASTGCYQVFRKLPVIVDGIKKDLMMCYDFLFMFKDLLVMKQVKPPQLSDIAVSTTGVLTEGESVNQHLKSLNVVTRGQVPRICAIPETDGLICGIVSLDPTPGFKMVLDPGGVTGDILLADVQQDESGSFKINVLVKVCRPIATHALIARLIRHGGIDVKYSTGGRLECANVEVIQQSRDAIFQAVVNAFKSPAMPADVLVEIFDARHGSGDFPEADPILGEFSVDGVIVHVSIDPVALVRVCEEYIHDCIQILMRHASSNIKSGDQIRVFAVGKILTNRWGTDLLEAYLNWRQGVEEGGPSYDLQRYSQHVNAMTDGIAHVMRNIYNLPTQKKDVHVSIESTIHSSYVRVFPQDVQSSWGFITVVTVGPSKRIGNGNFGDNAKMRPYSDTVKGSWMTLETCGQESAYLYEDASTPEERGMYIIPYLFKDGTPSITYNAGIVSVVQNGTQELVRLYEDHVVFLSYTVKEFAKLFSFVNILTRGVQGDDVRQKITQDVERVAYMMFSMHQQTSLVFNWKQSVYSLLETLVSVRDQLHFERFQELRTPKIFRHLKDAPFGLLTTHLDASDEFEKVLLYSSRVTENK
jgi:hypothetical protein